MLHTSKWKRVSFRLILKFWICNIVIDISSEDMPRCQGFQVCLGPQVLRENQVIVMNQTVDAANQTKMQRKTTQYLLRSRLGMILNIVFLFVYNAHMASFMIQKFSMPVSNKLQFKPVSFFNAIQNLEIRKIRTKFVFESIYWVKFIRSYIWSVLN